MVGWSVRKTNESECQRKWNDLYVLSASGIHHTEKWYLYDKNTITISSVTSIVLTNNKMPRTALKAYDTKHTRAKSSHFGTSWTFNIDHDFSCCEFYTYHFAIHGGSNGIFSFQLISLVHFWNFSKQKYLINVMKPLYFKRHNKSPVCRLDRTFCFCFFFLNTFQFDTVIRVNDWSIWPIERVFVFWVHMWFNRQFWRWRGEI